MKRFEPNAQYLIDAALNRETVRLPLYEHGFDPSVVEKIINEPVLPLLESTYEDHIEAQRRIVRCGIQLGYDVIPFERPVCRVVQNAAALCGLAPALIETMEDLEGYPWDKKAAEFLEHFEAHYDALREALPEGMKAVGGIAVGTGNQISDYTKPDNWIAMCEAVREWRGEK